MEQKLEEYSWMECVIINTFSDDVKMVWEAQHSTHSFIVMLQKMFCFCLLSDINHTSQILHIEVIFYHMAKFHWTPWRVLWVIRECTKCHNFNGNFGDRPIYVVEYSSLMQKNKLSIHIKLNYVHLQLTESESFQHQSLFLNSHPIYLSL